MLRNYEVFDLDTVNDSLQVISQLIAWNALELFSNLVTICKQMLSVANKDPKIKQMRRNLVRVVHSVADKGMDYSLKIDVLIGLEYSGIMQSFKIVYRNRNSKASMEEQEEEEEFFAMVSESVMKMGLWSLELFQNHTQMLPDP